MFLFLTFLRQIFLFRLLLKSLLNKYTTMSLDLINAWFLSNLVFSSFTSIHYRSLFLGISFLSLGTGAKFWLLVLLIDSGCIEWIHMSKSQPKIDNFLNIRKHFLLAHFKKGKKCTQILVIQRQVRYNSKLSVIFSTCMKKHDVSHNTKTFLSRMF